MPLGRAATGIDREFSVAFAQAEASAFRSNTNSTALRVG
jgi:hypothetical protein